MSDQQSSKNRKERKKTILVVEDDRLIADSLAIRLTAAGYKVKQAYDGAMGLATALSQSPDLLILDISMPAISGFSLGERIRNEQGLKFTPIIFMTAFSNERLRDRAEELQAHAFFQKPYDSAELMAAVRSALGEESDAG